MRSYARQVTRSARFQMPAMENGFRRTSGIDSCFDFRNLSPIRVPRFRADVMHAGKAEPFRVTRPEAVVSIFDDQFPIRRHYEAQREKNRQEGFDGPGDGGGG